MLIKQGASYELTEGEFWRGRARVMPVRELSAAERQAMVDAEAAEALEAAAAVAAKQQKEKNSQQEASDQAEKDRIKRQIRNAAVPYSDLESALYKKWVGIPPKSKLEKQKEKERKLAKIRLSMDKDAFHKVHYKGAFVKRRALIDKQAEVDHNPNAHFSYAERKRNWTGEDGVFESAALQEWYTVVDQTTITKQKAEAKRRTEAEK